MTIGATGYALAAYRAAAGEIAAGPSAAPADDFDKLLRAELHQAVGALERGEQAGLGAVTGSMGIQEVVEAVTAAELTLQKVTAVRDRVISAYHEIMRMPI
jgi:flagellar hook-basal body complex protein FliE